MAKTLEELMAELEAAAKDRMKTSVPVPESDATIYESDVTIPEADSTLPESDTVYGRTDPVPAAGEYKKGQTLLDTYTVESDPIHGGMGSVWRVHHNGWNVELAMKRPQAKLFQSDVQKENFIEECKAWIDLGLHPNIVSCYYVREIDGVPTIFSEWMENGSLENHIQKGTLYAGTTEEQQERLLDIAIQFARGLHYAHEQGRIHQDVKPDNLMLTKDWDAKVADFGLAKARAQLTILEGKNTVRDALATVVTPSGGYTPAYCSMEQMDGKPLTRRTDIYSWAVSVMEMYLGERPWMNGVIAGLSCEGYFADTRVSMPEGLKTLLARCMAAEPEQRPHDFAEVERELLSVYEALTGSEYPRPVSSAAADTADSLNNRALSYLDMGKTEEAERLWKKALEKDSSRFLFHYNYALYRWNQKQIIDRELMAYLNAHRDGSELCGIKMDELYCMRGGWDQDHYKYSYNVFTDSRPETLEPLLEPSRISRDGKYRVEGYVRKDRFGTYHYGYTIEDLSTGEIKDHPNDHDDYGISTPRDGLTYINSHYYKSDKVSFLGPHSEFVAMEADVLWIYETASGRLLLSLPPIPDSDGDTMPYSLRGYTESGLIEYEKPDHWYNVYALSIHTADALRYELAGISTVSERLEAEKEAGENYAEALACREKGDIPGVWFALNRSLEKQVLVLHEPSLRLWTELGQYLKHGKLVSVLPTEDAPTEMPERGQPCRTVGFAHTEENMNHADNGQTGLVLETDTEEEYDWWQDSWSYTIRYSVTATDILSGRPYFRTDTLETAYEESYDPFSTDRYIALKNESTLLYAEENKPPKEIDLRSCARLTLPGGYELFNTEKGVNIGGFEFNDRFDDFRPLWNADVIACRDHNYRLVYRYEAPET